MLYCSVDTLMRVEGRTIKITSITDSVQKSRMYGHPITVPTGSGSCEDSMTICM